METLIEPVRTRRQWREFVFFPERLYRDDPLWAPPLWSEERQTFSARNPILSHSDWRMFLARRDGRVAGRILAYVDRAFNDFYGRSTGLFGSFECQPDPRVAGSLFREAESWLRAQGMDTARGPINPVSECWGFLHHGFDDPPMFMAPYNPPAYNDYAAAAGYAKVKDLLAYDGDARQGYRIPERFVRFRAALLKRRPSLRIRRLDLRNLAAEAEAIWRISNEAIRDNWGFVPLDKGELESMFRQLRPIADPDAIWMIEDAGTPVGYALGFPDLNVILRRIRGRLLPFGFLHLLLGVRRLRDYRLFGLAVMPAYHGLGLDVLLYMSLFEALAPRGVHLEANYILEDNPKIRNALEKLGLRQTKVYRVYEKPLV